MVKNRSVRPVSEGMIAFQDEKSGKWGYKNENEDIVIECKFDFAESFKNGFAEVGEGELTNMKKGLINKNSDEIIPCEFSSVEIKHSQFHDCMIYIGSVAGGSRIYFENENDTINTEYDSIKILDDEIWQFKKGNKLGLLNNEGHIILEAMYKYLKLDKENNINYAFSDWSNEGTYARKDVLDGTAQRMAEDSINSGIQDW